MSINMVSAGGKALFHVARDKNVFKTVVANN